MKREEERLWWKTSLHAVKEAILPAAVGAVWATITIRTKSGAWTWTDAVHAFGGAFFFVAYFGNAIMRVHKRLKDDARHNLIITEQDNILQEMKDTAKAVASYATGGDSFCYVGEVEVKPVENGKGEYISEIKCVVNGRYSLHDVVIQILDLDDPLLLPTVSKIDRNVLRNKTVQLQTMTPGTPYFMRTGISLSETRKNRIEFNWMARNGSWQQYCELVKANGVWRMATFVTREGAEIYLMAESGYNTDSSGRPTFDLTDADLHKP